MTTKPTKIFVTDTRGVWIDWYSPVSDLSTEGQSLLLTGNTGPDVLYVGNATVVDATALGSGADVIYLQGKFSDYDIKFDQSGRYTITGLGNNRTEVVTLAVGDDLDQLYFADGHLTTDNLTLQNEEGDYVAMTETMLTKGEGQGTPVFPITAPAQGSAVTKIFVTDTGGVNLPAMHAGAHVVVTGNTGADTLYVANGTVVDATALGSGADVIYLQGKFSDYDIKFDQSGRYTITGLGNNRTEVVTLAVGDDLDQLYFADGHLTTDNLTLQNEEGDYVAMTFAMLTTGAGQGTPGLTDVVDLDTTAAGNHYTATPSLNDLHNGIAIAPNAGDSQRDINSITVVAAGLKSGDLLHLTGANNTAVDLNPNSNITQADARTITIGSGTYRYTWLKGQDTQGQATYTLVITDHSSATIPASKVDAILTSLALINPTAGSTELGERTFSVTLQNEQGSGAASVAKINVGNAVPQGGVSLDNLSPHQGDTLTLSTANLTDADGIPTSAGAVTYRWQRSTDGSNYTDISDATATTYTLTQADVGTRVRALVRYTDNNGSLETVTSTASASVIEVNDAPTLSATAANPTFTEGAGYQQQGTAVALFSGAVLMPEPGNASSPQKITSLTLTVADLRDGSHETLIIDGTSVSLVNNAFGNTVTNGIAYSVSVASAAAGLPVATITLSKTGGITADIINGIQYQNTLLDNPTAGTRTATIIGITDDGGTAFSGQDSATVNIVSTITVTPVDDPTQLKNTGTGDRLFSLNQSSIQLDTSGDFLDPEGDPITYSVTGTGILPTGLTLDASTGIISGTPSVLETAGVAITVTASDGHTHANGANASRVYNIRVTDAPVVSRISVSDDTGAINIGKAGDTVTVVITLTEAVSVSDSSGASATINASNLSPTLKAGASGQELHIDSVTLGADAKTITVIATLPSGDATSIVLTGLNPNGITLTGTGSNQPFNGYTSGGTQSDTTYTLDNTAPNIATTGAGQPALAFTDSSATPAFVTGRPIKAGEHIVLTIPLGEDASGLNHLPAQGSTASHILSVGNTDKDAIWSISGSNLVLTYTVGPNDNGNISVNPTELKNALQAITDKAGNALTIGGSASGTFGAISTTVAVDTTAPSGITGTFSTPENTTAVGTLSATDINTVTWALNGSADDNAKFTLASNGALTFKNAPNFETRGSASGSNSYLLHVQATDAAGNVSTSDVTVNVSDVNEPTQLSTSLGATSKTFFAGQNSVTFNVASDFTDPDANATLTYSVVGSLPAGLTLDAATGIISGTPTATSAGNSVVTVTASDGVDNGADASRVYTLSVAVKPTVTGITVSDATGDATAGKAGDTFTLTIHFSEPLNASVTPSLANVLPTFKAGNNPIDLTNDPVWSGDKKSLIYTLSVPNLNTSRITLESLSFAGTGPNPITFTGADSNQTLDPYTGNLGADYRIDNTAPTIFSTGTSKPVLSLKHGASAATQALDVGDTLSVSIPLGEAATGITLPSTTSGILTIGGIAKNVIWSRDGNNLVLSYTIAPGDNGNIAFNSSGLKTALAGVTDLAGNALKLDGAIIDAANTASFTFSPGQGVDTTFPVLTANASYSIAENTAVVATLTGSDAVTAPANLRYSIVGGADATKFNVDTSSGVLSFKSAPNFEDPKGGAGNSNTYAVIVGVSDAAGHLTTQAVAVSVTDVNDAPSLSVQGNARTFTEGTGAGVQATPVGGLFSGAGFNVEPGNSGSTQIIQQLVLTVSGLKNGANEILVIDGQSVPLVATVGGTTANGIGYGIVMSGANNGTGTATVTLSKTTDGGITAAIINGLQYQNTNVDNPTTGTRTITLTQIQDNGGGTDTTALNFSSTVTVVPTNDNPTLASGISGTGNVRLTSGITLGNADALRSTIRNAFTDPDGDPLTYTYSGDALPSGLTLDGNGYLTGSTTSVGSYHITVSASDGIGGSTPATREYDLSVTDAPVVERITVSDADGNNVGKSGDTVTVVITLSNTVTGSAAISVTNVHPVLKAGDQSLTVTDVSLGTGTNANLLTVTATLPGISQAGQIKLTDLTVDQGLTLTAASGNVFSDETELDFSASYTVDNTAPNLLISGLRAAATDNSNAAINTGRALRANDHVVITIPMGEAVSGLSGLPAQGGTAGNIFSIGGTAKDARWSRSGSNLLLTYTVTTGDEGALSIDTTALKNILQSITDTAGNAIQLNGQDWASNTDTFALSATPANAIDARAPGITSATSLSLVENSTTVATLGATDGITTNAGDLSWSIEGGTDRNLFTLDRSTGVLVFKAAPDFEGTHGNTYQLTVGVTDQAGNKGTQALTITVSDTNDAPGASITPSNATFTEGSGHAQGTSVSVFNAVTLSPEPGNNASTQKITQLVFTVAGLKDGTDEKIIFDGSTIALSSDTGTTANHTLGYSISLSDSNNDGTNDLATVTLSSASGIAASDLSGYLGGLKYLNTNVDNPGTGTRVFTLMQIKDDGGTANGGADTSDVSLVSRITVTPVNDVPELASGQSNNGSLSIRKNGNAFSLSLADHFTDPDSTLTFSATTLPTGLTLGANGLLSGTVTAGLNTYHPTITVSDGITSITRVYDIEVWAPPTVTGFSVADTVGNTAYGNAGTTITATITLSDALTVSGGNVGTSTVVPTLVVDGTTLTPLTVTSGNNADANKLFVTAVLPQGNASSVSLTGLTTTNVTLANAGGHPFEDQTGLALTTNYTLDNTAPAITSSGANAPTVSITHNNGSLAGATDILDVGDTISISVPLGEAADGLNLPTNRGQIININGTSRTGTWSRNGNNLVLSYTIVSGDDGAITVNPGKLKEALAITDLAGNGLTLDGTSIGASTSSFNIGNPGQAVDTTAPTFTGNATLAVFENTALVTTLTASDAVNTGTLRYSIESGGNGNLFALNTSTGVLSFQNAPDFETPRGGVSNNSNTYTVNVGVSDASNHKTTRALTITVSDLNEAPTVSATASGSTFAEGSGLGVQGSAVAVFSAVTLTPEPGAASSTQNISRVVFTVSGLKDGNNEKIIFDGSTLALSNGISGNTTGHTLGYSISLSNDAGTNDLATVTLSNANGIVASDLSAYLGGLKYLNTNIDNPTPGNRVFTLMQIKDNGGTANGGNDTATLNISSTVNVSAVNDSPVTLSASTGTLYYTNGTAADNILGADFSDPDDAGLTYTAVGSLPDGLTLNSSTGHISGTPTADGTTPITVHVSDGHGGTDATKTYSLVVSGHPAITGISAYDATGDTHYGHSGDTVTIAVAYNQTLGAAETLTTSNVQATLYAGGTALTVTSVSLGTDSDANKLLLSATVPAGIDTSTITLTGLSFTTTAAAALITSTGASHSSVQDFSGSQTITGYTIDNTAPNVASALSVNYLDAGGNVIAPRDLKAGEKMQLLIPMGEAQTVLAHLPDFGIKYSIWGFAPNEPGAQRLESNADLDTAIFEYLRDQHNISFNSGDTWSVGGESFDFDYAYYANASQARAAAQANGVWPGQDYSAYVITAAQRKAIIDNLVTITGNDKIIKVAGVGQRAGWSFDDVNNNLVLSYTPAAGDTGAITVDATALKTALSGITDLAGNPLTIGGSASGTFSALTGLKNIDTTAPSYTGAVTLTAYENATAITTLAASDNAAASDLRWAIVGGTDAAVFSIDSSTGALSFKNPHDYEAEAAAGAIHGTTYSLTIGISDAAGNTTTQALTITLADVNDAPTITATASGNTFTEGSGAAVQGDAVQVFSAVTLSPEPGNANSAQKITQVVFTISGLKDGDDEAILLPGSNTPVPLSTGSNTVDGLGYSISVTSSTASVTLSNSNDGITSSALTSLKYINTNLDHPTTGDRTFTITSLTDDGGTTHGGVNTASVSLTSVIHVSALNDDPVLADGVSDRGALSFKIGAVPNGQTVNADFTDPDADTLTYTAIGSLPGGLGLNPNTGAFNALVDANLTPGTYAATIAASDGHGGSVTRIYDLDLYTPPGVLGFSVSDASAPNNAGKSGDAVSIAITLSEAITTSGGALSASSFVPTLVAGGNALTLTGVTQGTGTDANVFTVTATLPGGNAEHITLTGLSVNGTVLTGNTSHHAFENQSGLNKTAAYTLDNTAPNVANGLTVSYFDASNNVISTVRDLKAGEQVRLRIDLGENSADLSGLNGLGSTNTTVFSVGTGANSGRTATWQLAGRYLDLTYTLTAGDNGALGISTSALKTALGSAITDRVGNAATLGGSAWGSGTFNPLGTLTSADTTGPNITSATIAAPALLNVTGSGASAVSAAATHDLKAGDTITLTIPVGETTTGLLGLSASDSASPVFKVGGEYVTSTWSRSGTNLILTHAVASGETGAITTDAARLKTALQNLSDALGNPVTLNNTAWNNAGAFTIGTLAAGAYVVDTTAPNIATTGTLAPQLKLSNSSNTVLNQDLAVGDQITLTVPLGEAKTHFDASTLNLVNPSVLYAYNGFTSPSLDDVIGWVLSDATGGNLSSLGVGGITITFDPSTETSNQIRARLTEAERAAFARQYARYAGDGVGVLNIGGQYALFTWSTTADSIVLTYTVQSGDNGAISVDTTALRNALSGIKDKAGNPVTFGGGSLSFDPITTPYGVNTSADALIIRTGVFSTPENTTGNLTLVATEASLGAGGTLHWALTPSDADNSLFNLNTATGVLSFKTAPDFENAAHGPHYTAHVVLTGSDGSSTATRDVVVSVTDVNDAPNITANATGNTFTEGGGTSQGTAVAVFSGTHLDAEPGAISSSQKITQLVFTVSGLKDGNAEKIILDGSTFSLTSGTNGTTSGSHSIHYGVTQANGTATVTLTSDGGIDELDLNGLQYINTNIDNPTSGSRVFTVTSIGDDGGTANGGVATRSGLSVSSTIGVTPVNDAPRVSANASSVSRSFNKNGVNIDLSADFVDPEGDPVTYSATGLPSGLTLDANGFLHGAFSTSAVSFTVTATDGQGSITRDYTPTVIDRPSVIGIHVSDEVGDPHNAKAGATFAVTLTLSESVHVDAAGNGLMPVLQTTQGNAVALSGPVVVDGNHITFNAIAPAGNGQIVLTALNLNPANGGTQATYTGSVSGNTLASDPDLHLVSTYTIDNTAPNISNPTVQLLQSSGSNTTVSGVLSTGNQIVLSFDLGEDVSHWVGLDQLGGQQYAASPGGGTPNWKNTSMEALSDLVGQLNVGADIPLSDGTLITAPTQYPNGSPIYVYALSDFSQNDLNRLLNDPAWVYRRSGSSDILTIGGKPAQAIWSYSGHALTLTHDVIDTDEGIIAIDATKLKDVLGGQSTTPSCLTWLAMPPT